VGGCPVLFHDLDQTTAPALRRCPFRSGLIRRRLSAFAGFGNGDSPASSIVSPAARLGSCVIMAMIVRRALFAPTVDDRTPVNAITTLNG
jgi:hypothetical protein